MLSLGSIEVKVCPVINWPKFADIKYMTTSSSIPESASPATAFDDGRLKVTHGDALIALRAMPDESVHAVVTDPPYAINRAEAGADPEQLMQSAMLGMQSQNWHESATHSRGYADSDPHQFQTWCEAWLTECHRVLKPGGHLIAFGGTRTWHRLVSAAEDVDFEIRDNMAWLYASGVPKGLDVQSALATAGRHEEALRWEGWGTTLKPGFEPFVLARKPLEGTVTENLERHSTGALNLGGCRVLLAAGTHQESAGRWPTNVHVEGASVKGLVARGNTPPESVFFVSKPNAKERTRSRGVEHPTVKPLTLMRHLVRLVTPPGGTVLDPFAGSGTTLEAALIEGFHAIGIEREAAYVPLILERIRRRLRPFESEQDGAETVLTLPL